MRWVCLIASCLVGIAGCSSPPSSSQNKPAGVSDRSTAPGSLDGPIRAPEKGPEIPVKENLGKEIALDADIPAYPNAKRSAAGEVDDESGGKRYEIRFYTEDSVDKALAFYNSKWKFDQSKTEGGYQLMGQTEKGSFVIMTIVRAPVIKETVITARVIKY
jgi:hypothetical protein